MTVSGMGKRRVWVARFVLLSVALLVTVSTRTSATSEGAADVFAFEHQTGKVHPELYRLESGRHHAQVDSDDLQPRSRVRVNNGLVSISAVAQAEGSELLDQLSALGLTGGVADGRTVTGHLPVPSIDEAGELASLQFIRPVWKVLSVGSVTSQGDSAMKADVARAPLPDGFDVDGSGVTVGTISDSFNCALGYDADVQSGDLPAGIVPLKDDCPGSDEGRAMMQHIADVAPGATQLFHTAGEDQVSMALAVEALKTAGADVIVDDVAFLDEPWFQDGPIAQAVDVAAAAGVGYFSAAGNSGRSSYESSFRDAGLTSATGQTIHDFDPTDKVDIAQRLKVPPGAELDLALQWDDNFGTLSPTAGAPKTDLDFVVLDDLGDVLAASILRQSTTLEPVEAMPFSLLNVTDEAVFVDVAIIRNSGPTPARMKWIDIGGATLVEEFGAVSVGTVFGHAQALGAMSVGAASALQTVTPPLIELYSSVGGGSILRDRTGSDLGATVSRQRPTFVGPDDANTTFFGVDSPIDDDAFKNFPGTSAAAPHAAAVAALALDKEPTATRDDICNVLSSTAVDMGSTTGADAESGHGFIDANAALAALPLSATATRSPRCATVQLAIDSITKKEGSSGTTKFTFKITKLGTTYQTVSVAYATADGTAKKGDDYKEATGSLTFNATDLTKTVDVEVTGDTTKESDEAFDLTLSNAIPANVVLLNTSFGTATIDDDDDPTTTTTTADGSPLDYVGWGKASKSKAEPGDKVTISGAGFESDASLAITFHSTPVALGSVKSTAAGAFSVTITIPGAATSGKHEIHAVGTDAGGGTRTIRYPITIVNGVPASSPGSSTGSGTSGAGIVGSVKSTGALPSTTTAAPSSLPRTGGSISFLAELGTILLLVGSVAIFGSRRRERPILGFDIRDV